MTTKLRHFAGTLRFILAATAMLTLTTILIGRHYELSRADWPGWVQAVGSVQAILVAVWVSWQQNESQRRRDEAKERTELAGMLSCLRAEVELALLSAQEQIQPMLDLLPDGEAIRATFPLRENSFPIFDALIPKLGMIRDDALRMKIVSTYSLAKGFVLTIIHHNELVATLDAAEAKDRDFRSAASTYAVSQHHATLVAYSDGLRDSYNSVQTQARELIATLSSTWNSEVGAHS